MYLDCGSVYESPFHAEPHALLERMAFKTLLMLLESRVLETGIICALLGKLRQSEVMLQLWPLENRWGTLLMLLGHAPESRLLLNMGKNTRLIVICEGLKVITKKKKTQS